MNTAVILNTNNTRKLLIKSKKIKMKNIVIDDDPNDTLIDNTINLTHGKLSDPLNKNIKYIYQFDLEYIFISKWKSVNEIIKANPSFMKNNIRLNLNCYTKSSHGFVWSYDEHATNPKIQIPIYQYDIDYKLIREYKSCDEIARINPTFDKNHIKYNIKNKINWAYGYNWAFEKDFKKPKDKEFIYQYTMNYQLVNKWNSFDDIIRHNNTYKQRDLLLNVRCITNTVYGFVWSYKSDLKSTTDIVVDDKMMITDKNNECVDVVKLLTDNLPENSKNQNDTTSTVINDDIEIDICNDISI